MKFPILALVTVFSTWVGIAAGASDSTKESGLKLQEKSLPSLVQDLMDDEYQVRENATREIWKIGEPALAALQEIATGEDPEQVYRARELIRMIQLHITPETDPEVIALVERYSKASSNEKVILFDQMHKRRAWRQLLKLYATERSPDLQARLKRSVDGVAVAAARERLMEGDVAGAREFLEMAPADAEGLLALADFHRSQGTWEAELKMAKAREGVSAEAWRLALYRASGDLEAARNSADAAGEWMLSALMSTLLGDPLPWLRKYQAEGDGRAIHKPYTELAIRHWQGKAIGPDELMQLIRSVKSKNSEERQNGMNSLFLLGQPELAEKAYAASSKLYAFSYFESLERIPEALKTLGLDPENPDYAGWAEKRFEKLTGDIAENDRDSGLEAHELVMLANFLERRGLHQECEDVYLKPLLALAKKDVNVFTEFLGQLFGGNATMNGEVLGAPLVAKKVSIAWMDEDAERWEEVLDCAFGGQDEFHDLRDWMADLKPKASREELLDGMLALVGIGKDPDLLREKWLKLAWEAIEQVPEPKRKPMLENMNFILMQNPDIINNLKLWDMLPESRRPQNLWRQHILDLSGAGRWEEAAKFFQKQIDTIAAAKLGPEPSLYACLAACLRNAGHVEDAAANDEIVEKLALGNDAIEIANGYAYGLDYNRATDWWARAARQSDPASDRLKVALELHSAMMIDQEKWKELAAVSEVRAQMEAADDTGSASPLPNMRLRLQADLGRALSRLKTDRSGSIATLGRCHEMFPSDGSLADDFFPAIRKMGLIKEHDAWFKTTWARMSSVLAQFPDSDNTCNTAAWLASRAIRNLDQAEKLAKHALALNPEQSAYLDTMAEIQFAKGNRDKAIEWSTTAINYLPIDSMLRRQHERFLNAPLPR